MAEGTSLLRMHTAYTCIVGSNPTVSARINKKASPAGGFFVCLDETVRQGGWFEGFALASANPLRIAQLLPQRGSAARRGRAMCCRCRSLLPHAIERRLP